MRTFPLVAAAGALVLSSLAFVPTSATATAPAVRNGGYVEASAHPQVVVEFVVADHGTRVVEDGIDCSPNASLIALGATAGSEQYVPIVQPLPGHISKGGVINYSTTVNLTQDDTQSLATVTSTVALTIHFLKLSKVVVNKTIVATGTVFVPNVCPGATPTHFKLRWDPSARL